MSEENQPPARRINLRDRLGRAGGGAATPAPTGSGGIPAPVLPVPSGIVPPPAISTGIPVPPFATPSAPQPATPSRPPMPTVDPADPYAVVRQAPEQAKPQEIKVDVSEAAQEAAKGMRKFIALAGVAGVLIGGLIGNVVGTGQEKMRVSNNAVSGSTLLAGDVEKANGKIKELGDKIGAAAKSLKEKKFPESFASELGGVHIPFDGEKLAGKGIGAYPPATLKILLEFTADVESLNDRKEALKGLFSSQKQRIVQSLEAADKPTVGYTLLVTKTPKGNAVGSIARVTDPFGLEADWPKEYKMTSAATGEVSVSRYDSGDPVSTKDKRIGIPIEPKSIGAEFPNDITGRILGEVIKTGELLNGKPGVGEDDGKPGLIKNGEALVAALKKLSEKKQ